MEPNKTVSFFVGAHPDDWQIFAGNVARDEFGRGNKLVFVYMTAGDDCQGEAYWRAREKGAIASTVLLTSIATIEEDSQTFPCRPICRYAIGNTASYFLRLPEHKLRSFKGGKPDLRPVDGSTLYADWSSLVKFVESILEFESSDCQTQSPLIYTSDYLTDPFPKPNIWMDHEDHAATGDVVRMIATGKYDVRYWPGYEDTRRRQAVSDEDFEFKRSLMKEYCKIVKECYLKQGDYESAKDAFEHWMRFTYYRTESA
jgi:hypothetical protein